MDEPELHAQRWRLTERGRRWFDIALATALLVPVVAMPIAGQPATWTVLCVVQLVPLYFRRRHAVAVFVVVALATGAQALLIDSPLWSQIAFPVRPTRWPDGVTSGGGSGQWSSGSRVPALRPSTGCAAADGSVTFGNGVATFLTIATIVVAAWALGTLGRVRSAYVDALVERSIRVEREAAQQVELAASEERARIAREMHDVVAHGLSVMVVQADGARYAAEQDPAVATRALETIADTGREALAEMRRLLGLLRSGEVTGTRPQPRLDDIACWSSRPGRPAPRCRPRSRPPTTPVPDGVALTAYRIVQESLSNVRKHAGPGAAVAVTVRVDDDLAVLVEDDGRGASTADDGRGLGLVGMRERVAVHDGTPRGRTPAAAAASGCRRGSPCDRQCRRPRGRRTDPGVPGRRPGDGARRLPDARRQPGRPRGRRRGRRRRRGRAAAGRHRAPTSC